jgi:hypothetical protein
MYFGLNKASCFFFTLTTQQNTAPLAFLSGTGVNDELDGTKSKSAVRFTVPNQDVPRGIQVKDESLPPSPCK